MKGFAWSMVGVLAFLYILGTAGALEMDTITLGQFGIKMVIGFSVFAFAMWRGDRCSSW